MRVTLATKSPISDVIGPNYSVPTRFALVEFGDYQCPPCRAHVPVLEKFVFEHNTVKVLFRHYPLVALHPYAKQASLVAAAAHRMGHFDDMHSMLMRGSLDSGAMDRDATRIGLSLPELHRHVRTDAILLVRGDQEAARRLRVAGTPSFFLCDRRSGTVYRLRSLRDVGFFNLAE